MLELFTSLIPALWMLADVLMMLYYVKRIFQQRTFRYFDKTTWLVIVVLGNIVGQVFYVILENPQR